MPIGPPILGFLAQRPQSVHSTGKNPQTDNLKRFSSLAAEHMSTVFAFNAFQAPWPSSLPFLSTYFLSKSLFLASLRVFLNRVGYVQLTIMGVYRRRTPNTPNS